MKLSKFQQFLKATLNCNAPLTSDTNNFQKYLPSNQVSIVLYCQKCNLAHKDWIHLTSSITSCSLFNPLPFDTRKYIR